MSKKIKFKNLLMIEAYHESEVFDSLMIHIVVLTNTENLETFNYIELERLINNSTSDQTKENIIDNINKEMSSEFTVENILDSADDYRDLEKYMNSNKFPALTDVIFETKNVSPENIYYLKKDDFQKIKSLSNEYLNSMVQTFYDERYRKHINRLIGLSVEMDYVWFNENENKAYNEYLKYMGTNAPEDVIIVGHRFLIKKTGKYLFYMDHEGEEELIINLYDWIENFGVERYYGTSLLKLWCEKCLHNKIVNIENLTFISLNHTEGAEYTNHESFLIAIDSIQNNININHLKKIKESINELCYDEYQLIQCTEEIIPSDNKVIGVISSFEQYEDILKIINYKELILINERKITKEFTIKRKNFKTCKYPKEWNVFFEKNKQE